MTLRLKPDPTFWAPVEIPVPGGEPQRIEVEFRLLPLDQVDGLQAWARDRKLVDAMAEVIAGWRGVDTPYSEAALRDLDHAYWGACDALLRAYVEERRGAKRKN